MNIEEAVKQADGFRLDGEVLNVVGSLEKDPGGKVKVYPDPYNMSHYVLVDPDSVAGEVLDVTEHARRTNPSRRGPVFSVPVGKGAKIQIVSVTTVTITDVAKMRFLSLNQSGCGCGCSGKGETGEGKTRMNGCTIGNCITIEGFSYDCWETWEGLRLCSGCCLIAVA
jgi:hypothetical protein